ncbi:MAG: Cof-type HAD-IIB family hydrolase [Thermoplasmata archaeon]|nr:Cof-type HAD-IIB family hydrolase [Thermoplasmata archaeon]
MTAPTPARNEDSVHHIRFRAGKPTRSPRGSAPSAGTANPERRGRRPAGPLPVGVRSRRDSPPPRPRAFVSDLDRTLLRPGGRPTEWARAALQTARAMGLRTMLVSGRTYSDLTRLARPFGAWDALVAENGAVVEAPCGSSPLVLGSGVGAAVRRRLRTYAGKRPEFGRVVVSFPRRERRYFLQALHGLPVDIIANVDRLMVLPLGVTKRSGVRLALRRLGLGGAGYAAIGDASNDLELLDGASLSGAVANAESTVRSTADYVCRGSFDRGVLEFVSGPLWARVGGGPPWPGLTGGPLGHGRGPR